MKSVDSAPSSVGPDKQLSGKTAIVTGASSGLGAHFAEVLARNGAHVVLAARREGPLQLVAEKLARVGSVAIARLDVSSAESRTRLVTGLSRIDILVNNAGTVHEGPALLHSEAGWDEVLGTNLKGMFFLAQAVAQKMMVHGGGSIVNISSILGLRQASGVISYAVSKAGVIQLTKTLALEWARHGVRVNALAPGYFETELNREFWTTNEGAALIRRIPQRRLGKLQDLDAPLLLLASDTSRYMTGSILTVDGGHLVSSL